MTKKRISNIEQGMSNIEWRKRFAYHIKWAECFPSKFCGSLFFGFAVFFFWVFMLFMVKFILFAKPSKEAP